jgi:hypothetical protein
MLRSTGLVGTGAWQSTRSTVRPLPILDQKDDADNSVQMCTMRQIQVRPLPLPHYPPRTHTRLQCIVAFTLNATVDVAYSRLVKPIAIPSTNQTLLGNLSDTYDRVTRLFDVSKALWNTGATSFSSLTSNGSEKSERPAAGMKRMPSEKPSLTPQEFIKVSRAEKRCVPLPPLPFQY